MRPVLKVGEVCDKGGVFEILLRGEVIEIEGGGEGLYELGEVSGVILKWGMRCSMEILKMFFRANRRRG